MNVLDNHITDLDNRIKEICETAPTVEQSSIQESLSSYGWILLDSWIAWRTLRYLLRNQNIKPEIQKKWFQTPSSFTASQVKAVWSFDENVDLYFNEHSGFGLKHVIDDDIEKMRNLSAHFSSGGVVKGSDYQRISMYHHLFSNVFLLYEILSFFVSISINAFRVHSSCLIMIAKNGLDIFNCSFNDSVINYDFPIIDFDTVELVKMEFQKDDTNYCLYFDKEGRCYLNNVTNQIGSFKIFSNKGYYRDISLIKEKLKEQDF